MDQVGAGSWKLFTSWQDVVSGLGWGLGYFGMPHIIIRFMAVRSDKDMKKSAVIGISWTVLILSFAVIAGLIGRMYLGEITDTSTVFIQMVRKMFPPVISGVLLSAILAASMSTADSQLLSSASAFASDVYKPIIRKGKADDREMLWVGRAVVLAVAIAALLIASNPESGSIMNLVSNAWGVFGAAFGPAILLSLFWRRLTFGGAVAGIVVGAVVDMVWLAFLSSTAVYEIVPGFLCGLAAAVAISLLNKEPAQEVTALFDKVASKEEI
jgi:sodium/proline symporter